MIVVRGIWLSILLPLLICVSACYQLNTTQETSSFVYDLEIENIRMIRSNNDFLLHTLSDLDEILDKSSTKYVYDFSSKVLKTKYDQALKEFGQYDKGRYTIYELCERLNNNRLETISLLYDSISNEVQWYNDQLEDLKQSADVSQAVLVGDGKEVRQLYLKTLIFYNRLISIGLNYVEHVEKEEDIMVPLPILKGDSLEIYTNAMENNPLKDFTLRVNNDRFTIKDGKQVISLKQFNQDTIWLRLEIENRMTGVINMAETYYLNK